MCQVGNKRTVSTYEEGWYFCQTGSTDRVGDISCAAGVLNVNRDRAGLPLFLPCVLVWQKCADDACPVPHAPRAFLAWDRDEKKRLFTHYLETALEIAGNTRNPLIPNITRMCQVVRKYTAVLPAIEEQAHIIVDW